VVLCRRDARGGSGVRLAFGAGLLLMGSGACADSGRQARLAALVHRDVNGLVHIEAPTEATAWYALGYEEARDNLLNVQTNVKRVRGEAARYLGDGEPTRFLGGRSNLFNDLMVTLLETDLERRLHGNRDALRELLGRRGSSGPRDQVFRVLEAYAQGLDDYRRHLAASKLTPSEQEFRDWLDSRGWAWVYRDEIDVFDAASFGPWTTSESAFMAAMANDPAHGGRAGGPEAELVPSEGSSCFAWSHAYMQPRNGVAYSGHVADPHGAAISFTYPGAFDATAPFNTFYCAHLVVPGELDVFGYLVHGAGMFSSFHNWDVAVGGATAAANVSDSFLLRLREAPDGSVARPPQVYSYYLDEDGDSGGDEGDWLPLVPFTCSVARREGAPHEERLYSAGALGFLREDAVEHPLYGPVDGWDVDGAALAEGNHLSHAPSSGLAPLAVAYRIPQDPAVARESHHDRLSVGMFEVLHARTVYEVQEQVLCRDLNRTQFLCCSDRAGRVFASMSALVPRRGQDASLEALGIDALDKFDLYDKFGDGEPVPARNHEDLAFDWSFDESGTLQYLRPEGHGEPGDAGYLAYASFDPTDSTRNNPPSTAFDPRHSRAYENIGFAAVCNGSLFQLYKTEFELCTRSQDPCAFRRPGSSDNEILDQLLRTGTLYHAAAIVLPAVERNRSIVATLTDIASGARPPLDLQAATAFAQDTRSFVERDYRGFELDGDDGTSEADNVLLPGVRELPPAVRQLVELRETRARVLREADREARFFRDLLCALEKDWGPWPVAGSDPPRSVDLRALWIDNAERQAFWYPASAEGARGPPLTFALPENGALIDFLWDEVYLGGKPVSADGRAGFSRGEEERFVALVNALESGWKADEFRNSAHSREAALLFEYRLGFTAQGPSHETRHGRVDTRWGGRTWVPLFDGRVAVGQEAHSLSSAYAYEPRARAAELGWSDGQEHRLVRWAASYRELENLIFDGNTLRSVLWEDETDRDVPVIQRPLPPYRALYRDVESGTVKTAEELTPEDISELVSFFLELGGFQIVPDGSGGWTSTKPSLAPSQAPPYRPGYPLTRNLARVTLMRRLVETRDFLDEVGPDADLGELLRVRVHDLAGRQRWPPEGGDRECEGGAVRWVRYGRAATVRKGNALRETGFQRRVFVTGGSRAFRLTLFPEDPALPPLSYYTMFPGLRVSAFDSPVFAALVDAFRTGVGADSFFSDYREHLLEPGADDDFPANPYLVFPQPP